MINEEYQFILAGNDQLFSSLYYPDKNDSKIGVLFCDPIFEEKLWAHKVLVNLARHLAEKNINIFRFDYSGLGDSSGHFKENTLETYTKNISHAADLFKTRFKLKKLYLLGLRFGAFALAHNESSDQSGADGLILLDPVIDTDDYIMQCLRSNLTSQMALYKKVQFPREALLESLDKGEVVDIDGYEFTPEFYKSFKSHNLINIIDKIRVPVFLGRIVRKTSAPVNPILEDFYNQLLQKKKDVRFEAIETEPFWVESRRIINKPMQLFDKVEEWLFEQINTRK